MHLRLKISGGLRVEEAKGLGGGGAEFLAVEAIGW